MFVKWIHRFCLFCWYFCLGHFQYIFFLSSWKYIFHLKNPEHYLKSKNFLNYLSSCDIVSINSFSFNNYIFNSYHTGSEDREVKKKKTWFSRTLYSLLFIEISSVLPFLECFLPLSSLIQFKTKTKLNYILSFKLCPLMNLWLSMVSF